jgi:hypothetical protein
MGQLAFFGADLTPFSPQTQADVAANMTQMCTTPPEGAAHIVAAFGARQVTLSAWGPLCSLFFKWRAVRGVVCTLYNKALSSRVRQGAALVARARDYANDRLGDSALASLDSAFGHPVRAITIAPLYMDHPYWSFYYSSSPRSRCSSAGRSSSSRARRRRTAGAYYNRRNYI